MKNITLADRIRAVADEIQPYCQENLGPNELWNALWGKLCGIANDIDALDAEKELMDCKGYDLFPDGTLRPAHGLGEWVKAEDYDKLHAIAEAAQAEIAALRNFVDKNMTAQFLESVKIEDEEKNT